MKNSPCLYEQLKKYAGTDYYPFHMPGHKRQLDIGVAVDFPNPYGIDITEIEGFDNLHHAEGIIRESMDWVAKLYGADRTYYLVNGSSGGILSAISAGVKNTKDILISRNCHKAVYHGIFLNHLKSRYIYPQFMREYGIQCGLKSEKVREMLKSYNDISAVLVVSPTYDGIVSDIRTIAEICHSYKIPLIVDEAHGAHFRYSEIFPVSALELGADVVIQSVHKTLPCFTQSALLHIKEGYVNTERIEDYLQIYQSSSPSYVLMAGIEHGIRWMEEGQDRIREFSKQLLKTRRELEKMRHLKLLGKEIIGNGGIYDIDISKIIVSTKDTKINGPELFHRLHQEYHLELEMYTEDYVTAITTVMDTEAGLDRLKEAFWDIDKSLDEKLEKYFIGSKNRGFKDSRKKIDYDGNKQEKETGTIPQEWKWKTEQIITIYEAWSGKKKKVLLEKSAGEIIAEFIYLYPPGIPVLAPGERITQEIVELILHYQKIGLPVQGMRDKEGRYIEVVAGTSLKV